MRLALIGQTSFGGPLEAHYSEMASKYRAFVEALEPLQFHDWNGLKKLIEDGREPADVRAWMAQLF
jgi:succinate dehydrogenase hydrophobic anchor subunit